MKKLNLIILLAVLAAGATFAGDAEYPVTLAANTSTAILPPRIRPKSIDGYFPLSTAVTNGYLYRVLATGEDYMVLTGGTTTNAAPTGVSGQVEANGTATVIHCAYKSPRIMAYVTPEADADIWYHTGYTATTNGGQFAYLKGQQLRTDEQQPTSAISTSAVKLNIKDN